MNGLKNERINGIFFVFCTLCIFFCWDWWTHRLYPVTGDVLADMRICLGGFQQIDMKFFVWIMLHIPVQTMLVLKLSDFFGGFSVLCYFRDGRLLSVFQKYYRVNGCLPFFYYFTGFTCVFLRRIWMDHVEASLTEIFRFILYITCLSAVTALIFTCIAWILYMLSGNYQTGYLAALMLELVSVLLISRMPQAWYLPLTGTVLEGVAVTKEPVYAVLILVKLAVVMGLSYGICKCRFHELIGME
ncbi:MAG: hypothetical protein K2N46_02860 [Lachnospiraceae bacterium]|nr:hypothetical protein [Lachnospiraceae bacterium]